MTWHLYGEFKQYSHKKIHLWGIRNIDEEYPSCFFGPLQYLVNNKNLGVYNHKKKMHQTINWPEASEYIPSIQRSKAEMKIHKIRDNTFLLQIGGILLYIYEESVQHTFCFEGDIVITKNVATWLNQGMMKILTFQEDQIYNHGDMEVFDGHFYGSAVQENKLMMLFYDYREIKVRSVHLVSEE